MVNTITIKNHRCLECLLKCLFRGRSKNTSKLCVTGLCEGNPPVTGEFPTQRASNLENLPIWWRNHANQLHKSTAYQHLKSPWSLSMVDPDNSLWITKMSRSWSWMTDTHPFCSIWIGHPIPEIRLFWNLTMKINGQGHACGQRSRSHYWLIIQSIYFLLVLHQLTLPFLRYSHLEFDTENPRSKSWPRSFCHEI